MSVSPSDAREVIQSFIGRGHEDSRTDWEANGWGGSGRDPNYYRPAGCLTNTEHPPFSLRRLCCGLWGEDMGFSIPMIAEVAGEHTVGISHAYRPRVSKLLFLQW